MSALLLSNKSRMLFSAQVHKLRPLPGAHHAHGNGCWEHVPGFPLLCTRWIPSCLHHHRHYWPCRAALPLGRVQPGGWGRLPCHSPHPRGWVTWMKPSGVPLCPLAPPCCFVRVPLPLLMSPHCSRSLTHMGETKKNKHPLETSTGMGSEVPQNNTVMSIDTC